MAEAEIVNQKDYNAYEKRMQIARGNLKDAKDKVSAAWWALYEIDRDKLYAKAHGYTKSQWVAELATHEGISRGDFYRVMKMIEAFQVNDVPDEMIRDVLGDQMTALKVDLAEAFNKRGKLLPEVKERIEEEYGSLAKLVASVASQPKGQARDTVNGLMGRDKIFALDDAVLYNPQRKELKLNVRHDDDGGLVGIYTLTITSVQIADGVDCLDPKYLPEKLARWVGGKLGVQV